MIHQRLALFVILIVTATVTASAQNDTIFVATEEVRIDVLVTDKGKPVPGMQKGDFEVFDNGVPQEIQYAALQKQIPISATLVFDMSSSVAGELLNHLKDAAYGFLANLRNEDYAALITFNNAVVLGSPPTRDLARIKLALDRERPSGNSSLIDGSYAGLLLAESRPDPPLLIIFSDGLDTFSWLAAEAVLEIAKRNDAVVYALSTGRLPDKTFLSDLAKLTGGSLVEVESNRDLAAVFIGILEEFRQRYLLTYTPRGVSESGWHKVDVRVKHRSAKVSARPGYMRSAPRK